MTKEPADWAKIKAYRAHWPEGGWADEKIVSDWPGLTPGVHELARMYDKYEKPPVDPDLLAAREWLAGAFPSCSGGIQFGDWDNTEVTKGFLAGIKHGRANP